MTVSTTVRLHWIILSVTPYTCLTTQLRGISSYPEEHIWWDQATVLRQIGAIPSHVPWPFPTSSEPTPEGIAGRKLRLPVSEDDLSARLLIDETDGTSNEMFGEDWGVVDA